MKQCTSKLEANQGKPDSWQQTVQGAVTSLKLGLKRDT